MKKILLSILSITAFGVNAQNVNIPDANFKAYLVGNTSINTNVDTEIQVSEASAFTGNIICSNLSISDMTGLGAFTMLDKLDCRSNNLTTLNIDNNTALTELYCQNNQLSSLNTVNNSSLTYIYCSNNSITSLDVFGNTSLSRLDFQSNLVSTIDLSNNSFLSRLYCQNNQLSSLDVSSNLNLALLYCVGNQISTLDLSSNASLGTVDCSVNNLVSLDLSSVSNGFNQLICNNNNLSTLILPNDTVTSFWRLYCSNNVLTSIDFSANTAIESFQCNGNILSSLNVANGNNSNISSSAFWIGDNPDLTCVQVDDVAYSTTNWTFANGNIDSTSSFSTNCTVWNEIEEEIMNEIRIYPNPVSSQITIDIKESIEKISIFNITGELIQTATTESFPVENLSNGVYMIIVKTNNGIFHSRFIKE